MKTIALVTLVLAVTGLEARADFSYSQTRKNTGGMMAAGGSNQPAKYYFKGQKMKVDNGDTATIIDFEAETVTSINNSQKTVTIKKFSDLAQETKGVSAQIDVKETGQKKVIDGYNAGELVMTMTAEFPQAAGAAGGMKMQMEMDMWISPDVPGARDLRAFYRKNESRFPWAAIGGGAGSQMQSAMADMQHRIASMDGVPVLQVIRVKPAGGSAMPQMPQMTSTQTDQMAAARARLQTMIQQGGPAAAAAQQALSRMPGGAGGPTNGSGATSGALLEITMESRDFSTASLPDSTFAVPAGYQQK